MRRRWTPRAAWRRALVVQRQEGLKSLWYRVLGETVYRRLLVLERPFADLRPASAPLVPVVGEELGPDAIDEYLVLRPDFERVEIEERFPRGEYLFGARLDGRLVGAAWIAHGSAYVEYLEREVRLRPGVAYIYDLYVAPDLRGRGVDRELYRSMIDRFGPEECTAVMATANVENRTQKLFERIGFRRSGILGYYGVGPARRHFAKLEPDQTILTER